MIANARTLSDSWEEDFGYTGQRMFSIFKRDRALFSSGPGTKLDAAGVSSESESEITMTPSESESRSMRT